MITFIKITLYVLLGWSLYHLGIWRLKRLSKDQKPVSLPQYYGFYLVFSTMVPLTIAILGCQFVDSSQVYLTGTLTLTPVLLGFFGFSGFLYGWKNMQPSFKSLKRLELIVKRSLFLCAGLAVIVTFSIVLSMIVESLKFFQQVALVDFLFGTEWVPHGLTKSHSGSYGAIPLFTGTLLIMGIAMLVAIPLGVMSAIYLSQYASQRFRAIVKPLLEILAGIPTVIYGFFAVVAVSPLLVRLGSMAALEISSESALGAGLVMGVMILPYISSLSEDVLSSIPHSLKEASLGMGATISETIKGVLLPAASPGIIAAILLGISRAVGETMLVLMAVGLAANLTLNPLSSATTVTVQIVSLLTGDQSFDSPAPLSAFALGLTLFIITLILNMIALKVVNNYRKKYEF